MKLASLAIPAALAIFAATAARGEESIPPGILQKVKRASVYVKVNLGPLDSSGSGFVVHAGDQALHVVTNAHVVAKPDLQAAGVLPPGFRLRESLELRRIQMAIANLQPQVTIVLDSGTSQELSRPATVVAIDSRRDLAVLKVTDVASPPEPIPLDATISPRETTPIFIFGYPFGDAISISKRNPAITVGRGTVSSLRVNDSEVESRIQIDGALNPGNSGGPVVDAQGRLVGVAVATIRGTGIGFAIPPATLQQLLEGGVSDVQVARRPGPDGWEFDIELTLIDPFHKIHQMAAYCACREVQADSPPAQQPLPDSRKIDLTMENGKARGTWKFGPSPTRPDVVAVQPVRIDADGNSVYLKVTQIRIDSPATQPGSRTAPRYPVPGHANDVHVIRGFARKVEDKALAEGMLFVPRRSPALGLGVMQTGESSMRMTYFLVVRLPPGGFSRKTSVMRNTNRDGRARVFYGTFLDDQTLALEHSFTATAEGIEDERFTLQDQEFDPQSGRLFLVDLTTEPTKVVQQNVDLPALGAILSIEEDAITDLVQKTYKDLLAQHPAIGAFVESKK